MALGKYEQARSELRKAIELLEKSTSIKGERKKAKERSLQKLLEGIKSNENDDTGCFKSYSKSH